MATHNDEIEDEGKADGKDFAKKWIELVDRAFEKEKYFREMGNKTVTRYMEGRSLKNKAPMKFNILYSNVQTTKPLIYSQTPKPNIARREKDKDDIGRVAALMLERATEYCIDAYDLNDTLNACVTDYQLPGRAQVWLRYDAVFGDEIVEFTDPVVDPVSGVEVEPAQEIEDDNRDKEVLEEAVRTEYVHWMDFTHGPGRVWSEVMWVCRVVYMDRKELTDRFGKKGKRVKLDHRPKHIMADEKHVKPLHGGSGTKEELAVNFGKAVVYEIWDKKSREVIWIAPGMRDAVLDKKDDILNLNNFFPCPRPLLSDLTTNDLIPIADYIQYADMAAQLDVLSHRMHSIVNKIRANFIFNAQAEAIADLLNSRKDGEGIPVENWQALTEQGGAKNAIEWIPFTELANTYNTLLQTREKLKQDLFEITGISDILRGQTRASETLGAQQIKSNFASGRVDRKKREVARFARDIIRIKAEIIAEQFEPDTIAEMSNIQTMSQTDLQFVEPALELIQDNDTRGYKIDIETDSTVAFDQQADKAARVEFLAQINPMLQQVATIAKESPEFVSVIGELMLFGVQGFKQGAQIEGVLESAVQALNEKASQPPPPPPPDPKIEIDKAKLELEAKKLEFEREKFTLEMQLEKVKFENEAEIKKAELQLEAEKAVRDAEGDPQIFSNEDGSADVIDTLTEEANSQQRIAATFEAVRQQTATNAAQTSSILAGLSSVTQDLVRVSAADVELIRDASNKPIGSRKVLEEV